MNARRKRQGGFTLLEVLVAATIMAIAVTGLLTNLRTSTANASRVTETERIAGLARQKLDEFIAASQVPLFVPITGVFPPEQTGGVAAGFRTVISPYESVALPGQVPAGNTRGLERIQLEIWWGEGSARRTYQFEAYRGMFLRGDDMNIFAQAPAPML